MTITKRTANKLIAAGKAEYVGRTFDNGSTYAIVIRFDLQRHDHYFIACGDVRES